MTVIIEETDRDTEYIEDVAHVHFQVDNWVKLSFEGKDNQAFRIDHTKSVSIVP